MTGGRFSSAYQVHYRTEPTVFFNDHIDLVLHSRRFGDQIVSIDFEDYDRVSKLAWYIDKSKQNFYAKAKIRVSGKLKVISLHRFILNFPSYGIDHRDCNGLNNRKHNLRPATNKENSRNCRTRKNISGFKGVRFAKDINKFHARIVVNREMISGGLFDTAIEAAEKYNELAVKHFGEFARLNEFKS